MLPAGVLRGMRDALLGRSGGAGRAAAILAGVATTAAGYAVGSVRGRGAGDAFVAADLTPADAGARRSADRAEDLGGAPV